MKFFRTHIARTVSIFMLFAGMMFYLIHPASDKVRHEAFTSWLQSNLKSQDNADVLNQIDKLSAKKAGLESVIREASKLVRSHSEDFELPVNTDSEDENEVYHLLLSEWNQFRHSASGMGKAVVIENGKSHSVLPTDGLASHHHSVEQAQSLNKLAEGTFNYPDIAYQNYHISPLSGGAAIGAP